ncbi:MAG: 2-phospho-L-lactate transferase [Micrococcales bacterium]|nr:MAG: 2-phospho-L-lactate transferase [Micrococcales bacterium]
MKITALSGGVGGARFLTGVLDALSGDDELTVIANTADDIVLHGLRVSPDVDTVLYTLGGGIHPEQGWGRARETFSVAQELAAYGRGPSWFTLGDRDFATHIVRTALLGQGYPLHEVVAVLASRWLDDLPVRLLPMTNADVQTHVIVAGPPDEPGETMLHFQEWWVGEQAARPAHRFEFIGIEQATAAPGVLKAIESADVLLLPPSNPVVSIGPILQVCGIRAALVAAAAPVVGVSPIIGTAPVRGMADACLRAVGVPSTPDGVAGLYRDFLDGWLVHAADAEAAGRLAAADPAPAVHREPLYMSDPAATARIATAAMDLAKQLAGGTRRPARSLIEG